ncbi:SDR family NAD(P)-dependent oxidoreductase [Leucobacter allii]|uniref:SDR family NAD(P)-dependent oxidoreductase n=1 Tax=Leucobacter allii TaxID=2932247 RepID=A0ABY4FKS8_9MICO|nr:SDR family NAD(P)-dependent oxidoreductase [Leucobacter allii]UOQ56883.1 SDR family NAD(P)-dependent oxidoreductase [Leucobacter allii]
MTEINGRVAVVTGGASGIGLGIAEALREAGAAVVIADIEEAALARASAELRVTGKRVDVADPDSVQRLADEVVAEFGPVGIVVNNAGVGPLARIEDLTLSDWDFMLNVNLKGVIHGVRSFLPLLIANPDGGHLVNTGSMASFASMASGGAYNVTKYGVAALTETLALELAEDHPAVRATLLAPGTVRTNIKSSLRNQPAGRSGGLADVDISGAQAADMRWIDPLEAGRITVNAIRENRLYALTHPDWWPIVETRFAQIERAFADGIAELAPEAEAAP